MLAVMICIAAPTAAAADAARGRVVAEVRCTPCHHLHDESRHLGPSLKGLYGRAPMISDVPFESWDAGALYRWLSNPRAVKPNTKMVISPLSAKDKEDIIAYFKDQAEADPGR